MNIRGQLKITTDLMIRNGIQPLLLFLMGFIALYMVDTSISTYVFQMNIIKQCKEPFLEDIGRVHYIGYQDYSESQTKAFLEFRNNLAQIDDIDYYGCFFTTNFVVNESDSQQQILINSIVTDRTLLPLSRTGMSSEVIYEIDNYNGDLCPIFVGADLEEKFPVGTKLACNGKDNDCVVIGVLDKGAMWAKSGKIDASNASSINLDNQMLLCPEDFTTMVMYGVDNPYLLYYICDENNEEAVSTEIDNLASECNYSITHNDISDMIENVKSLYGLTNSKKFYAAVLLIVLAIISMTTAELAINMYRKSDYGIMYAFGITFNEIAAMLIAENVIIVGGAALITWFIRRGEIITMYFKGHDNTMTQTAWNVSHNIITPIILLICALLIISISSGICINLIRREKPSEMIKQKE